jgi:HPt (histidine-containing phosphotransfer) domain-containing protein
MNGCVFKPIFTQQLAMEIARVMGIDTKNVTQKIADGPLPHESFFSYDTLLDNTGGDRALILDILQAYISTVPADITQLSALLKQQQWEQIVQLAHKLKGASMNICANALAQTFVAIQTAAEEHESERIPSLLQTVHNRVAGIKEKINQLRIR